jgi:hypothetical protein
MKKNHLTANEWACLALEAFADAANAILHVEIAAEAEADAMQYEASEIAAENDGIDFVQVYINGLPHEYATTKLITKYYPNEFLNENYPVNEPIELNGETLYLEETILDTCFAHGDSWEVWGAKDAEEKTVLMIYLRTEPIKARKKMRYPQENDYLDYRDGGDGWCASTPELLDI